MFSFRKGQNRRRRTREASHGIPLAEPIGWLIYKEVIKVNTGIVILALSCRIALTVFSKVDSRGNSVAHPARIKTHSANTGRHLRPEQEEGE